MAERAQSSDERFVCAYPHFNVNGVYFTIAGLANNVSFATHNAVPAHCAVQAVLCEDKGPGSAV